MALDTTRNSMSALSRSDLRNALLSGPALPSTDRKISGHTSNSAFILSDYRGTSESIENLILSYIGYSSESSLQWLGDDLSSPGLGLNHHILSSAAIMHAPLGVMKMKQGLNQIKLSKALEDPLGILKAKFEFINASAYLGVGVHSFVFLPVGFIGGVFKKGAQSPLFKRMFSVLSAAGAVMGSIYLTSFVPRFVLACYEGYDFIRGIKNASNLSSRVAFLQKWGKVDQDAIWEGLLEKHGSEKAARAALIQEARYAGKENLRKIAKELGISNFSEQQLETAFQKLLERRFEGISKQDMDAMVHEQLTLLGFQMKLIKVGMQKSAKMSRLLGKEGLQALKELSEDSSLVGRIEKGSFKATQKAQNLIKKIQASASSNLTVNALILAVVLIGMAATVASIILSSAGGVLLTAIISLLVSLSWLIVDGHSLIQSHKSERPAPYDKKLLALSSGLGIASTATMVALAVSGVFSMGIIPLVISIGLGALWLAQNAYTWSKMNRNERRFQEGLSKALQSGKDLNKYFSREFHPVIKQELNSQSFSKERVLKRINDWKKRRLELFKRSLEPLFLQATHS